MKTTNEIAKWGARSASFWLTLLIAAGIIFVGARFILDPAAGAAGFGVPFTNKADYVYGRIKGIRDIFFGIGVAAAFVFADAKSGCLCVYYSHCSTCCRFFNSAYHQWPRGYAAFTDPRLNCFDYDGD